jgi:hypothetical protein
MLLRPGSAGSNTFADHATVLTAAIGQIPGRMRARLLVRVDGAGASHELISHLLSLTTARRTVLFTCGWAITEADEQAIRLLPAAAWQAGLNQDGTAQDDKHAAEITHLTSRAGRWPAGLRWIVRRARPSRRQAKNLTAFEKTTGWRYSIIVTTIPANGITDIPGTHHPQFIDVLHREHAVVEDGGARRQGHGPAQPALQDLAGQLRLGAGRQHRRRPVRLVPPAWPLRPDRAGRMVTTTRVSPGWSRSRRSDWYFAPSWSANL